MRQLIQAFIEVEEKIHSLLEEVQSLKPYVEALAEENIRLKHEVCSLPENVTEQVIANARHLQGIANENLEKLYQEGFHVCHLHFAQPLDDGDCLFCRGFLHR
ncbi:MAG: DNA replication initiation control protein YabA [Peptococcaceae bacterium]|jgi:regulator of replication initiation timing|nr:DNA replication initiation control protein YabA [Peptococcaceae bacterium]